MDVEKIDGKKGVRIVENKRYEEIDLLTMRNGFQWIGAPVDRKLLVMVRDAINEFLGPTQETPPARPCVWRTGCKHPAVCDKQGVCVPGGESTDCICTDYPGTDEFCTAHDFGKLPPDTF